MKPQFALFALLAAVVCALVLMSATLIRPAYGNPLAQGNATDQQQINATQTGMALKAQGISQVESNSQWTPRFKTFDGVEMALVPPGCFMMGASDADIAALNKQYNTGWFSNQAPQTQICFDQPFWIDKYDVTNKQFKRLNGKAGPDSRWTSDNRPRESITWFEARDFCALRGARLPTEAEWEYAARGPDNLVYPWGNSWNADNAIWADNSGNQTADVGSKPNGKSWVGALDMAGNVWQWTSTIYDQSKFPYPYKGGDGREDNNDTNSARVLRGGSWSYTDEYVLRAAVRYLYVPDSRDFNFGFRCARFS